MSRFFFFCFSWQVFTNPFTYLFLLMGIFFLFLHLLLLFQVFYFGPTFFNYLYYYPFTAHVNQKQRKIRLCFIQFLSQGFDFFLYYPNMCSISLNQLIKRSQPTNRKSNKFRWIQQCKFIILRLHIKILKLCKFSNSSEWKPLIQKDHLTQKL